MKIFGIMFLGLTAAQQTYATNASVTCAVETLPVVCGSGHVKLQIVAERFELSYGDVDCWGSDIELGGTLVPDPRWSRPGLYEAYGLQAQVRGGAFGTIGRVFLASEASERHVARLTLDSESFAARFSNARALDYHLSCRPN